MGKGKNRPIFDFLYVEPQAMGQVLNEYFSSVFSEELSDTSDMLDHISNSKEVPVVLKSIKVDKSTVYYTFGNCGKLEKKLPGPFHTEGL